MTCPDEGFVLLDKHKLFQSLVENAQTVIIVFDRDLRVVYVNRAAEVMFERSVRQITGTKLTQLVCGDDMLVKAVEKCHLDRDALVMHEHELQIISGGKVVATCCVTPLSEDEPSANNILVEVMYSGHQQLINRNESMIAQLQANEAMLQGLAHEIKNPLGGLRGAAQLLERQLENPELKEYTGIIIKEADRLKNVVNQFLTSKTAPQKTLMSIHEVLERVRSLVLAETPSLGDIHRDYDPSIPEIIADKDLLIQAMLNLVRNAAAAVQDILDGRVELRSRVLRRQAIGSRVWPLVVGIDVIDNGSGVPANIESQVFSPMVTSKAEGTGLGLTIAQSLVHQHDGVIEYSRRSGKTVFSMLLPMES